MRWRLFMFEEGARWLEYPGPEELERDPEGWGLELPEGARVHSIQPLERQIRANDPGFGKTDTVTEWAIFVAIPVDEVAP